MLLLQNEKHISVISCVINHDIMIFA